MLRKDFFPISMFLAFLLEKFVLNQRILIIMLQRM